MTEQPQFSPAGAEEPALLPPTDLRKASKTFSRLGLGLLLFIGVPSVLQFLLQAGISILRPEITEEPWYLWALSLLPLYLLGFPLLLILFLTVPAEPPEKKSMPLYRWLGVFAVSVFVMYVGNIVGTVITSFFAFFKGGEVSNAIAEILESANLLWTVPAVVIVAPVMEELICRKLLIDRTRRYGELTAAFFSATAFGMIHGNFSQFFYAFGLGFVFAFVYLKTGRVIYTMLLHATVNFFGGVIGPLVLQNVDSDALFSGDMQRVMEYLANGGLKDVVPLLLEAGFMIAMATVGLVLLIVFRKSIRVAPAIEPLPRGKAFTTAYCNVGVILFILFCLVLFVLSLFT